MPRKSRGDVAQPHITTSDISHGATNDNGSSSSSSSSSSEYTGEIPEPPEMDISIIDQEHRISVTKRRSKQKTGRQEKQKVAYVAEKYDYIKWCALDGSSGNVYMRGVQVPLTKKPFSYVWCSTSVVLTYANTILRNGFQYKRGGTGKKRAVYAPENTSWFEDHLASCPSTMDDRARCTDKPISFTGTSIVSSKDVTFLLTSSHC